MADVSVVACSSYDPEETERAIDEVLEPLGGLTFANPGTRVVIKTNLVSMMKPESAATTHPALLCALVRRLVERGADVVIGDSPGGLYNSVYVNRVYHVTGMREAEEFGARLNQNYAIKDAHFEEGEVLHDFTYTAYLDDADAIIDFCKLKTHGMMGMSGAVKNFFGIIPGTMKPEYHFRFPKHRDFASMLIDLNEYLGKRLCLCICDAVVGMEGNGPTMGKPRKIGAVLASRSPHQLDLACASLIGLGPEDVPTLEVAVARGLIPPSVDQLEIAGELEKFRVGDFENVSVKRSLEFEGEGKFAAMFIRTALRSRPKVKKSECVGCAKCAQICPARAIQMKNGKPVIDRKTCITCFCCQEFCPKGAMKVHRPLIARMIQKK